MKSILDRFKEEKLAVHCESREQAESFLNALPKGYVSDCSVTKKDIEFYYKKGRRIFLFGCELIRFADKYGEDAERILFCEYDKAYIEGYEIITADEFLKQLDGDTLMDAIENPPEPNEKLKSAAKNYLENRGDE